MSDSPEQEPKQARRSEPLTLALLIMFVVTFGVSYYLINTRTAELTQQNAANAELTAANSGLRAKAARLESTIAEMEGASGGSGPSRRGQPLTFEYKPGAISDAWRAFQTVRSRVEQPAPSPEELEKRIQEEDMNGVRGPDLAEIECFEQLIGPEGSPYLRAIFESNAEEVRFSKDIGLAATFAPGLENLLAYFVTVGEPESLAFLEELLTGQIAQMAQTKFDGNYFTFATKPLVEALETCSADAE